MNPAQWDDDAEPWADDVAKTVVGIEYKGPGYSFIIGTGVIVRADPEERVAWVVTAYHVVGQSAIDMVEDGLGSPATLWVTADNGQGVQSYQA